MAACKMWTEWHLWMDVTRHRTWRMNSSEKGKAIFRTVNNTQFCPKLELLFMQPVTHSMFTAVPFSVISFHLRLTALCWVLLDVDLVEKKRMILLEMGPIFYTYLSIYTYQYWIRYWHHFFLDIQQALVNITNLYSIPLFALEHECTA